MFIPCYFFLLCLLLGGPVECRPITKNQLYDEDLQPLIEESASSPEALPSLKQPDVQAAHHLRERLFSKEKMNRSHAPKRDWLDDLISSLLKWLLIGLGALIICVFFLLYFLKNLCNKYGGKIPVEKLVDLYAKTQKAKYRHGKLPP